MRFEFVMTKCFRWWYKLTEAIINFFQPATFKIPSTFIVRPFYKVIKLTRNEDIYPRVLSSELIVTRVSQLVRRSTSRKHLLIVSLLK
jgi:hypothetical protein